MRRYKLIPAYLFLNGSNIIHSAARFYHGDDFTRYLQHRLSFIVKAFYADNDTYHLTMLGMSDPTKKIK